MIYILFSIISSVLIFVLFHFFAKLKVNNLYAIIANYFMAAFLGIAFGNQSFSPVEVAHKPWFLGAISIGFLFVAVFQIMAAGAQHMGVSRASVLVKMSVILPILAGVIFHQEFVSLITWLGILLALLSVVLASIKNNKNQNSNSWPWFLPVLLFLGPGLIDSLMKVAQQNWLQPDEMAYFSAILFGFSFVWGLIFGIFYFFKNRIKPTKRDVFWGLILGIPNFGSIYFILEALDKSGLPSATLYPLNNVAIVLASSLLGILLFAEKLSRINLLGLLCGIISIVIIAYV